MGSYSGSGSRWWLGLLSVERWSELVGLRMCFGEGQPDRLAEEYHVRWERREESSIITCQVFDLIGCLKEVLLFIAIEEFWGGADLWEVSPPCFDHVEF